MTDALSPSDGGDEEDREWDSLEEAIVIGERNKDREVRTSVRLWVWTKSAIRMVRRGIGTNLVEVTHRAYSLGLRKLRDEITDDARDVSEIVVNFYKALGNAKRGHEEFDKAMNEIEQKRTSPGIDDRWKKTDPITLVLRDSEYSEAIDTFSEDGLFGPWVHRAILAAGLLESEEVPDRFNDYGEDVLEATVEHMADNREFVERVIADLVTSAYPVWRQEGIELETFNNIRSMQENMETQYADRVEVCCDDLEDYVVTGGDDSDD